MMLRALVVFFLAVAAFEVVATALGELSLVAGLGAICLAVFFAGVLHGIGAIQQDLRALLRAQRDQRASEAPSSGTEHRALRAAPRTARRLAGE